MLLGKYQHYKGNYYEVLSVVLHTETREKIVLYKPLYDARKEDPSDLDEEFGKIPLFVRPKASFLEEIDVNGKKVPRFKKC